MPVINVQGQIINFPDSAQAPNWAPAVIQFAEAVALGLNSLAGAFDIPNQTFTLDGFNPGTNISVPGLAFPISNVRAAFIRYSVFRTTSTNTAYEVGNLLIVYNPGGPIGNKWEVHRDYVGNGQITFNVLDTGQVQFTTALMAGLNHTGKLSFTAQAMLQA